MKERLTQRRADCGQRWPDDQPQGQVAWNGPGWCLKGVAKERGKQGGGPNGNSKGLAGELVSSPYQHPAGALQGKEDDHPDPAAVAEGVVKNVVRGSDIAESLEVVHQVLEQKSVAGTDQQVGVVLLGIGPDGPPPRFSPGDGPFVEANVCGSGHILRQRRAHCSETARHNLLGRDVAA